ncbi:MAG: TIGR04552 family protein [Candidatus Bruticola sp.]
MKETINRVQNFSGEVMNLNAAEYNSSQDVSAKTLIQQEFSWEIIDFMLEGKSPIDLAALTAEDRAQAHKFLLNYGYDYNSKEAKDTVDEIFAEALRFIKAYFVHGHSGCPTYFTIPSEIERLNDVRDLLIWASGPHNTERQAWSCAILRVMHTIHHLDNTMRAEFFPEIKRQILDKFRQNVTEVNGQVYLGSNNDMLPLYGVYYKEEKSRDSLIMKLLHKPKNVAEKIHDRLGVKLVTYTKLDVLRVLYYLYTHNVIMFANLIPGRSRNTILDLEKCQRIFADLLESEKENDCIEREKKLDQLVNQLNTISPQELAAMAEEKKNYNPLSSSDYQSLQFTVQELVKLENPSFFKARRLRTQLEKYHLGPDLEGLLQELEGPVAEQEISVLFPLEVQIIDKDNYMQSIDGTASHDAYKQRQQDRACLRVLAGVFALHPELNPLNKNNRKSDQITLSFF